MSEEEVVTPTLPEVASVFARYANLTWGGGSATIAVLKRQIVDKRRWLRESEFELDYALSRLTPGTNLLAFCTAAGWTRRRWLGAIIALLASSIPCSLLVLIVTVFYTELHGSSWFQAAFARRARRRGRDHGVDGVGVCGAATSRPRRGRRWSIAPLTVGLALGLGLSPVTILLLSAVLGLAWPVPKKREPT